MGQPENFLTYWWTSTGHLKKRNTWFGFKYRRMNICGCINLLFIVNGFIGLCIVHVFMFLCFCACIYRPLHIAVVKEKDELVMWLIEIYRRAHTDLDIFNHLRQVSV